jgi:hypothetical protein
MSGAGDTDRQVWREFFDPQSSALRMDALGEEFARLWGAEQVANAMPAEAGAVAAIIEDEADRLETLPLDQLLAKYAAQQGQRVTRPVGRVLTARDYDRNPLVITIARIRASHKCEIRDCQHPTFQTLEGLAYTEVHHIIPLAHGGEDTIENAACLCPAHHREIHLGRRAAALTAQLKEMRAAKKLVPTDN